MYTFSLAGQFHQHRDYTMGWMSRVQFLAGIMTGSLSLHHHVHTSFGAHPASYPMGTMVSYPMSKAARVSS